MDGDIYDIESQNLINTFDLEFNRKFITMDST